MSAVWWPRCQWLDHNQHDNTTEASFTAITDARLQARGPCAVLKAHTLRDPQGAPYGYTPFCDNNKDMDGFRFWRQGFWKDHLRGKPYHISALYVVDLARFRWVRRFRCL